MNGDKKIEITLDNSFEDVVKYDEEGYVLSFSSDQGKFLKLETGQVEKLSRGNRAAYATSYMLWNEAKEVSTNPPTEGLSIRPQFATARTRLKIHFVSPEAEKAFRAKWHEVWKRPDELHMAQSEGYSVVTEEDGVVSFGGGSRNLHVLGGGNTDELVLMKCPLEAYKTRIEYVSEISKRRDGAIDNKIEETARRSGAKVVKTR